MCRHPRGWDDHGRQVRRLPRSTFGIYGMSTMRYLVTSQYPAIRRYSRLSVKRHTADGDYNPDDVQFCKLVAEHRSGDGDGCDFFEDTRDGHGHDSGSLDNATTEYSQRSAYLLIANVITL